MAYLTQLLHHVRAPLRRYGGAVLLTALALLLRLCLAPFLGDEAPLLAFFVPVVLSAWYGGSGPGLLAIALSVFAGAYFVLPPPYAFLADRSNLVEVGLFVLQGLLLTGLSALIHTRTRALRSTNDRLQSELVHRQHVEAALRESEAKLRLITQQLPAHVWMTDTDLRIRSIMGSVLAQLGIEPHVYLDKPLPDLLTPADHPALAAHHRAIHGAPAEFQVTVRDRCFDARVEPLRDGQGQIVGCVGLALDVTDRERAQAALRESEERFRQLAEHIKEVFWMVDPETQQLLYLSPAYEEIWGRSRQSLDAGSWAAWLETIHPEDRARVQAARAKQRQGLYCEEYRILWPTGDVRWIRDRAFPIRDPHGQVFRIVGLAEDITDEKSAAAQLQRQALYDALTSLPNRVLFLDRLTHLLARAHRHPSEVFAVLFLDLDRFKAINDSLGHVVGDQLLVGVARRLEVTLRPQDTLARLGGDEFVILLEDLRQVSDATHVAQRIHQAFTAPFQLAGREIVISASIGIALSTCGYERPEDLLRDADTALYRAKAQGKARTALFDPAMHTQALARLTLESELRRAIEPEELVVHYQPMLALATGQICGVEALVRWQHPERGLLAPAQFIPLAEETGLIVPVGEWVLRTTCAQAHIWQTACQIAPVHVPPVFGNRRLSRNFREPTARVLAILQRIRLFVR